MGTRITTAVIAALALLGSTALGTASADTALHEQRAFTVHVPDAVGEEPVPLVVALHGCSQDGDHFPVGTRFSDVADAEGFVVVYPVQSRAANASACWNWFLPEHQQRGSGEPAILAAIVDHVIATVPVDPARVYATGLSAGADMATVFAATYPDKVAAVAPVAGCAYLTCSDVSGRAALAAMGEQARPVPAMVVQSTGDEVNNMAMGETAVQQWRNVYDLASDGAVAEEADIEHHDATAGGDGDMCVRTGNYPCPAGALGWESYPFTTRTWHDTTDGCVATTAWTIHGAGHAWTGADSAGAYTESAGPDLTQAIWEFFTEVTACRAR